MKKTMRILCWLSVLFGMNPAIAARADVLEKPAIYLYPETDSNVYVVLDVNGAIFKSEPAYGTGWYVFVTKKGTIDNTFDYLFYEAVFDRTPVFKPGSWVVKTEDLQTWFDEHLLKLGLSVFEAQQFKEYWLNRLTGAAYYEIGLVDRAFLDEDATLIIVPRPQTVIRLIFYFIPLQEDRGFSPPDLAAPPAREGFTVVEWGGIVAESPERMK
jgi:internalin A